MWLVALLFSFLALVIAAELCFPDGIPESERVNLTNGAESYSLGMWVPSWAAGVSTSAVMEVLVNEKLGLHTVKGTGPATVDGFFAMAGCETPTDLKSRGCGPKQTYYHVHLEGWTAGYTTIWNQIQQDYPDTAPQNLGSMGYFGVSGPYISRQTIEAAIAQEGLALQYFRGHNSSWWNVSKYFDDYTVVNASENLKECNETRLMDSKAMSDYLRVTNDVGGVDDSSGEVLGRCFEGHFWFAPSCRSNPVECYPFITGGPGYAYEHTMQKATVYNIPIAILVGKTWGDFTSLPIKVKSSFYWWQPDTSFLELDASPVLFPPANRVDQLRGIFLTQDEDVPIEKYASIDLKALAPEVFELLKSFTLDMNIVNTLMKEELDTGDSPEAVACRWLKANQDVWESWIPDATECFAQFGLYNDSSQQFVQSRADPSGLTCRACDSGFYSRSLKDESGLTHICVPCAPGTAQPSGASLQCEPCPAGEYQDKTASASCKRCGLSTYQDEKGQSQCKACPVATTTLGLGSLSVLECACEPGKINVANESEQAVCTPCGEGLSCPFSSSLHTLKTGQAPLGEQYQPALQTGFYSTLYEPLVVFKCRENTFCPGGVPEVCGGGRVGKICGECPSGKAWAENECLDCGAGAMVFWWIAAILFFATCTGAYYFMNPKVLPIATAKQTGSISIGLTIVWLQTVGIIGLMTIEWPSNVSGPMSAAKVMLLDVDALSFSCFGSEEPFFRYLLKVMAFPCALVWMAANFYFSKCLPKRFQWSTEKTFNTIGHIMQVSFAIMCTIALQSMTCYAHPNGSYSLVNFSSITCGDGEQVALLIPGLVLLIIFVLGYLVLVTYATLTMPAWSARGSWLIRCFQFLIYRFRMDKWWFGLPMTLRGPLMSLVVTCATDSAVIQVSLNSLILTLYALIQATSRPWKTPLLNYMDNFTSIMFIQITLMSGISIQRGAEGFLGYYSLSVLILLVCGISFMCFAILVAVVQEFFWKKEAKDSIILRAFESCSEGLGEKLKVLAHSVVEQDLPLQAFLDTVNNQDLSRLETSIDLLVEEFALDAFATKSASKRITTKSLSGEYVKQPDKLPALQAPSLPVSAIDQTPIAPVGSNQDGPSLPRSLTMVAQSDSSASPTMQDEMPPSPTSEEPRQELVSTEL